MAGSRLATVLSVPILLLAGSQLRADDSFPCPVTKPLESASPGPGNLRGHWFGTDKLWTNLPGYWTDSWPTDRGYLQNKIVWFSSEFPGLEEPHPTLTITGRRLDGPSAPLIFNDANGAFGKSAFITSSVTLPTRGCWEITGHYKGQDLTFVVQIGP